MLLEQKLSGCVYLAVNTTSLVALEVDANEGVTNNVPQQVKIKAAYGSRQSYKTCNGADVVTVRILLCDEARTESNTTFAIVPNIYSLFSVAFRAPDVAHG